MKRRFSSGGKLMERNDVNRIQNNMLNSPLVLLKKIKIR
jgi:hypothetical protein